MAFALGFAGGFADAALPEPEPTPGIIGRGSGTPLFRTRWIPRQGQPAPPPVRIAVAFARFDYRWSVAITRLTFRVRLAQVAPRLSFRVTALTLWIRARGATAVTTSKVVRVEGGRKLSEWAYEQRELTEIALALTAWQQ